MIEFLLTGLATLVRLIASVLPDAVLTFWAAKAAEDNAAKLEKSDSKQRGVPLISEKDQH
jgi:hypothetical protein